MAELKLSNLPLLPQMETLRNIAPIIWENDEVVALWIIGSLARGKGDVYSDVDLGVAVKPESLNSWKSPDFVNATSFSVSRFRYVEDDEIEFEKSRALCVFV